MFAAKSIAPLAGKEAISRPVLDQAAEAHITFFNTPPGYLLSESLKAALDDRGHPTLWLRIGSEDRDPATFMLSLIAAAQRVHPGIGDNLLKLMQQHPGPIGGWSTLYSHLAQELFQNLPYGSSLVLEHVHNLNNAQPVIGLLGTQLLSGLPEKIFCILIAHERLPTGILPNNTITRGVKDLYINARSGLDLAEKNEADLSGDCIRRAISLIEGRAVALAGLFSASRALGPAFIQRAVSLSKNANHLYAIIARASLGSADPGDLNALSLAMHLDYIHPDLSKVVFGSPRMPKGPWIQPLADQWMRIRRLWQKPLRTILRAEIEKDYSVLYHAAGYLKQQGAVEQAINLFFELRDTKSAAMAIAGVAERMIDLGQWETLSSWFNQLPAESFQDWPWLLYMQGEIAAVNGQTDNARRSFSTAASLFYNRQENDGACQSLLAESTLSAWENDQDRAKSCALAAATIAEAAGLESHFGWAVWQLGCLASISEEVDYAVAYFSQAARTIKDPFFSGLLQEVTTITQNQRELLKQSEIHRQAYVITEQAGKEVAGKLQKLLSSPPDNLAALLGTKGWSNVPLMIKLPTPMTQSDIEDLPKSSWIWQGLLNVLRLKNHFDAPVAESILQNVPAIESSVPMPQILDGSFPLYKSSHRKFAELPGKNLREDQKYLISATVSTKQPDLHDQINSQAGGKTDLIIYCLGSFRFYCKEKLIENWTSRKSQLILKYLLAHRRSPVPKDILMDTFWPEADAEAARRNLHQAIYTLRQTLKSHSNRFQHILFENDSYRLNPDLDIWIDYEEFELHFRQGQKFEKNKSLEKAINEYEIAESLYQGDFMVDDLYEIWLQSQRQQLWQTYLSIAYLLSRYYIDRNQYATAISLNNKILAKDASQEEAHRNLMMCYLAQGQRNQAVRQYQLCVQVLKGELNVSPSAETRALYKKISQE